MTLGTLFKYSNNAVDFPHNCREKLKLIKNYLRSSMSTLRLRNLATLSMDIEQQLTDKINVDTAIEEFPNKKARKVAV